MDVEHFEIFNNLVATEGGALNYKEKDGYPFFKEQISSFNKLISTLQANKPSLPSPYVGITNSTEINAKVTKLNNTYFISVNQGAFLMLYEIFKLILSNPNTLMDVGNPEKETNIHKLYNVQYTDFQHYVNTADPNPLVFPNCEIRRTAFSAMSSFAIQFLLLHEYAHIANGHIDYLISIKKEIKLQERVNNLSVNKSEFLFSQTLEYDADCFATNLLLQIINDNKDAIYYYCVANYTLWRLFGPSNEEDKDLMNLSHPPTGIRQYSTFALIHTFFQSKSIEYANEMGMIATKAVSDVEFAFSSISEQELNARAFAITYTEKYLNHINTIRRNWNEIRSLLVPFSFTNLAPLQEV